MQRPAIGETPSPVLGNDAYLPTLGRVPSLTSTDCDLVVKATQTGIVFLTERRYKKRYSGSKKHAVDINGSLWLQASELKKAEQACVKDKGSGRGKKKPGDAPPDLKVVSNCSGYPTTRSGQISDEIPTSENFTGANPKKERKKSYTVNKKEVRQRILGYINTQRGKKQLFFWTVSFPDKTPDDFCYQALNTWLTMLRKYRMLKDYLWVAERQDGKRAAPGKLPTNTIHFHIAIPHYMNVHRANAMMRGTLKTFAKQGLIPYQPHSVQIAKYNGVDLCKHKVTRRPVNFAIKKGAKALSIYLTKYVTKNNAGVPNELGEIEVPAFTHLAWHNSRGFSALFTGVAFTITEFKKFGFGPFLNRVRVFKMNFATFVPWLYGPPPLLLDHLYQLNSYIQTVSNG